MTISIFDSTIPELQQYHAKEQLSSRKMNQTVDVINRLNLGVEPPTQIKPDGRETAAAKSSSKVSGLWLLYSDTIKNLILSELDINTLRPKINRWVLPDAFAPITTTDSGRQKPNQFLHCGGSKGFFYLVNEIQRLLYEYNAVDMVNTRTWSLAAQETRQLQFPVDIKPFAVGSSVDNVFYIGGAAGGDPTLLTIYIVQVVGENRDIGEVIEVLTGDLNIIGGTSPGEITGITGTASEILFTTKSGIYQMFTDDLTSARRFAGVSTNRGICLIDNRVFTTETIAGSTFINERDRNQLDKIINPHITPHRFILALG